MSKVELWTARGLGLQLVLLKPGGGPPYEIKREFLLIPFGTVETDNGTFYFNKDDAKEVLADRAGRPRVTFDYEHLGIKGKTEEEMRGAGSFLLELRSDGLWAVDVQYTPKAEEQVRNGERIYFSPAWLALKKTKHIVGIVNVALTGTPAMKNLGTLIAASRFFNTKEQHEMAHALGGHLQSYLKKSGISSAQFAEKSGIHADRMSKLSEGDEPSEEEMKACLKTMGIDKLPDAEGESGEEGEGADEPAEPAKKEPAEQTQNKRGEDDELDLVTLTGTKDPKKQNARLIAMAEKAKQFDEDHKKLETLSARETKRERERLVEIGRKEGKLTPPLERFYASRSNEELEEFLKHAPVVLNVGAGASPVDPKSPAASLSLEEREVCKMAYVPPDKLAQFKADEKSGKNAELILASYQS